MTAFYVSDDGGMQPCDNALCGNGGHCYMSNTGDVKCRCLPGFRGDTCQEAVEDQIPTGQ